MKFPSKINNSKKPVIRSEDEPIRVDFIYPKPANLEAGRIGITLAPGANHEHGNVIWRRNLRQDMARLKSEIKANVLISLVEDFELQNLQITDLPKVAEENGIKLFRFPLVDASVPENFDVMKFIINKIQEEFEDKSTVVIHCLAGLGRSAVVAAGFLATLGMSGQKAISHVQKFRKGSLFLEQQQRFVEKFAQNLNPS